jgi:hypothetical protein
MGVRIAVQGEAYAPQLQFLVTTVLASLIEADENVIVNPVFQCLSATHSALQLHMGLLSLQAQYS